MSHKADHPIAGGIWLLFIFGLMGLGAKAGIESSMEAQKELSRKAIEQELNVVRSAVRAGQFDQANEALDKIAGAHGRDEYVKQATEQLRAEVLRERIGSELRAARAAALADDFAKAEQLIAGVKTRYADNPYAQARATMYAEHLAALKDSQQQIREAVMAGENGEFATAEATLRGVLEKHPRFTDALFNLGIAQLAQGRDEEAEQTFQKVLEIDPEDWDAVVERAAIKKRKGSLDEALALLDKVPAGKGHIAERLAEDPLWSDVVRDGRIVQLLQRHGMSDRARLNSTLRKTAPEPESYE